MGMTEEFKLSIFYLQTVIKGTVVQIIPLLKPL